MFSRDEPFEISIQYPSPPRCDAGQRGSASRPVSDAPSGGAACSTFLRTVSRRFAPPDHPRSRASGIAGDDGAVTGQSPSVLLRLSGSPPFRRLLNVGPGTRVVRRRIRLLTVRRTGTDARGRAPVASRPWAPDRCAVAHGRCRPSIPHARSVAGVSSAPAWAGAPDTNRIITNDSYYRPLPTGKGLYGPRFRLANFGIKPIAESARFANGVVS